MGASAPFRLDLTVWALRRRPHNAVDCIEDGVYRRVLPLDGRTVEVAVRQLVAPGRPRLAVELAGRGPAPTAAAEAETHRLLARILGLEVGLAGFYHLASRAPV